MKRMARIQQYLDAVILYYTSPLRPYPSAGFPEMAFETLTPARILQDSTRTILLGPPGSGKTTFLDWTALYAAQNSYVPIFVSLRNYTSTLRDLLLISIERFSNQIVARNLLDELKTVPIVFLLDGLDEVPEAFRPGLETEIQRLNDLFTGAPIIVTSRVDPNGTSWNTWERLRIPTLDKKQIADVVLRVEGGHALWEKLSQNVEIMKLAERPVFLHTLRNAWVHGDDFRSTLMREMPRYVAWRGHSKSLLPWSVPPSAIDRVLQSFALDLAIRDQHSAPLERLQAIVADVAGDQIANDGLRSAVLSTDVIVQPLPGEVSFTHVSLVEAYAARSMAFHLRSRLPVEAEFTAVLASRYAQEVVRTLLTLVTKEELAELPNRLQATTFNQLTRLGHDALADRVLEAKDETVEAPARIVREAISVSRFAAERDRARKDILVIAVHGFNTRGDWKNELGLVLTRATDGERFLYRAWDYGEFRLGILNPFARRRQVEKFHSFFNDLLSKFPDRPEICIVAHSFGTYIVGHALRRFPEISFDRTLLLGSALSRSFDWASTNGRCGKTLNVIGGLDGALRFARFVPGLGDGGKVGFRDGGTAILQIREAHSDHSDLFGTEYMKKTWLPFIREGVCVPLGSHSWPGRTSQNNAY